MHWTKVDLYLVQVPITKGTYPSSFHVSLFYPAQVRYAQDICSGLDFFKTVFNVAAEPQLSGKLKLHIT